MSLKAMEGRWQAIILLSSSEMRSIESMLSLSAMRRMDSMDSGTMRKLRSGVESLAAKRTARSMRRGSSE